MDEPKFKGRSILVVEDEPFIAMDVGHTLQQAGASVTIATMLKQALLSVAQEGLSAGILGHVLGGEASTCLRDRLQQRGIPFVIYTGFTNLIDTPQIQKPALGDVLVEAIVGLLDVPKRTRKRQIHKRIWRHASLFWRAGGNSP